MPELSAFSHLVLVRSDAKSKQRPEVVDTRQGGRQACTRRRDLEVDVAVCPELNKPRHNCDWGLLPRALSSRGPVSGLSDVGCLVIVAESTRIQIASLASTC